MHNLSSQQKSTEGSRAVSHTHRSAEKEKQATMASQYMPNQLNLQSMANASVSPPAQRQAVSQMQLPHYGPAETNGYYKSQAGAKNKKYTGGRPVNFSTAFKMNMVQNQWGGQYNALTDMWFVQSYGKSKVVLPTNAIQIDHDVPWDKIEGRLLENPSKKLPQLTFDELSDQGYITPDGKNYTLYAARMYYHDCDNLKPWAGSENASKGASFASTQISLSNGLTNKLARSAGVHHELVVAAHNAYNEWGNYDDDVKTIMTHIDDVDTSTSKSVEALVGM